MFVRVHFLLVPEGLCGCLANVFGRQGHRLLLRGCRSWSPLQSHLVAVCVCVCVGTVVCFVCVCSSLESSLMTLSFPCSYRCTSGSWTTSGMCTGATRNSASCTTISERHSPRWTPSASLPRKPLETRLVHVRKKEVYFFFFLCFESVFFYANVMVFLTARFQASQL